MRADLYNLPVESRQPVLKMVRYFFEIVCNRHSRHSTSL